MGTTYKSSMIADGTIMDQHGYQVSAPDGFFTVVDNEGWPFRTHDGFAIFETKKQADWCAELMGFADSIGGASVRQAMRDLLGLPDTASSDDDA